MYAKLFASIYQGTLRGNTHGLVVFTNLLAHADAAGWADIHPRAIAEEVGLTVEQVQNALLELESPDPDSRSPEEDGRRIVKMDDHRAWGWRIVNHGKYRSIRSEEDRREQNRIAQEKWRNKNKPRKPESAKAEAEAEAEELKTLVVSELTPCPHQEIIDIFSTNLPELPQVRKWEGTRSQHLKARWLWVLKDLKSKGKPYDKAAGLDFFSRMFNYIRKSDFLMGKTTSWSCPGLPWIVCDDNFTKIIEGNYDNKAAA